MAEAALRFNTLLYLKVTDDELSEITKNLKVQTGEEEDMPQALPNQNQQGMNP